MDFYTASMVLVFCLGYFLITIEHVTHINKATVALLIAIICWIIQFANPQWEHAQNTHFFGQHLANISQVIFFLIGALFVVEIISAHQGFRIISELVTVTSKRQLLWILGGITFFLSAVLDNLTTTIVMVSLAQKLIPDRSDRLLMGGGIVIAANAGGAWTPIGDVTTTMLWIGGQISATKILTALFLPSLVCLVVSFLFLHFLFDRVMIKKEPRENQPIEPMGNFIFFLGTGLLIFVPIFKWLTGLPPFMGILFALSVLWIVTDIAHHRFKERGHLRVPEIITRVDLSGALFFLGILLCINALESAGILADLAQWFDRQIGNTTLIATLIGLASAIVDNVPLVAACMGMYDLAQHPMDSPFWQLVAFCAGTGGSILIIGSAAGVAFMGMEKADFYWYFKKISLPALVGYLAGIGTYILLMHN